MLTSFTAKSTKTQDGLVANRSNRSSLLQSSPLELQELHQIRLAGRSSSQLPQLINGKRFGRSTDPNGANTFYLGWKRSGSGDIGGYFSDGRRDIYDTWNFDTNGSVCGDVIFTISGLSQRIRYSAPRGSTATWRGSRSNGTRAVDISMPLTAGTYDVTIMALGDKTDYKITIKNAG